MLSSIHPLGERGRNNSYRRTVAAHLVAATAAGGVAGGLAGAVGWGLAAVLGAGRPLTAVALAGTVGAALLAWRRRPPLGSRQVDERWLDRYRGWVYGAGYGLQLGVGVATIVTTWLIPLTWVLAAATASPPAGLVIGLTYGSVRGASVLLGARAATPAALRRLHQRLADALPLAERATVLGHGLAIVLTAAAVAA